VFTVAAAIFNMACKVKVGEGNVVTGVQVAIVGGPTRTMTDANGDYSFADVAAGDTYFVTPFKPGLGFTPPQAIIENLSGNQTQINFTAEPGEVNDAPTANNDVLSSVAEDSGQRTITIASLLANDTAGTNESGQTLTLTSVGSPVGGTVSFDATNVYFTPAADFNGAASFQYTITDNGTTNGSADPKSSTATVSFNITPVADMPSVTNATTNEDTQTTSGLVISRNAVDGAEV